MSRILVFPDPSKPSMSILMSFLPNSFDSFLPIVSEPPDKNCTESQWNTKDHTSSVQSISFDWNNLFSFVLSKLVIVISLLLLLLQKHSGREWEVR